MNESINDFTNSPLSFGEGSGVRSFAFITGASKGIGKAIAEELAKRKFNLILVARNEGLLHHVADQIRQTYDVEVSCIATDLSNPSAPGVLAKWIIESHIPLSILINNAGFGLWGQFNELNLDEQVNMLRINIECVVKLTHLLIPTLKKQRQSYILNVASTAAYQAVPSMTLYAACNSFVVLFSRGLKYELKNTHVSVTCLSPGPTTSDFTNRAGMTANERIRKRSERFSVPAEDVAKFAVNKMFKKKNEVVHGLLNRISVKLTYFVPKAWAEAIAAGLYKD